jgi:hypothetical protein
MNKPKNNYEAYKLGLELAITAPTDKKSEEAIALTVGLEKSLTELEIARAKKECLAELQEKEG